MWIVTEVNFISFMYILRRYFLWHVQWEAAAAAVVAEVIPWEAAVAPWEAAHTEAAVVP
jgi:hypothetical protein